MNANQMIIKMVLDRWYGALKNCSSLIQTITDEQLSNEVAQGKNRGIYLLGHLIAVHDDMLALLDMGEKLYPELNVPFIKSADKATEEIPSATTLKENWFKQCEVIQQKFEALQAEQWLEKHTAVTAENFIQEPHRNKLNIVITRTTHLAYHTGQLALLK